MIRVLVVDDSPLARKVVTDALQGDPGISVAGTAPNAEIALKKIESLSPNVIVMDLEMPGMGGLEAIRRIMRENPTPIVVLSAFARGGAEATIRALELGAVSCLAKPGGAGSRRTGEIGAELITAVLEAHQIRREALEAARSAARERPGPGTGDALPRRYQVVAVGASAGGPLAVAEVLKGLPGDFPVPVLVVQHMPAGFTAAYARRLDSLCRVRVREAREGDELSPGRVLLAPGGLHLTVARRAGRRVVARLDGSEAVNGHRPSVDVLARSVADCFGAQALGVIMTGMGRDGARGFARLRARGGLVLAQDEATSAIYGMNRAVIDNGDADEVLPLGAIAARLGELCELRELGSPASKEQEQ
jgi:two-component system chemotaxis response regulator CheB